MRRRQRWPPQSSSASTSTASVMTSKCNRMRNRIPEDVGRRPQQRRRHATFFVNGRRHYGAYDIRSLTEAVHASRAGAALAA
jgi:hypothetical protein